MNSFLWCMNAAEEMGSWNWLLFGKWLKTWCIWILATLEEEVWIWHGTWKQAGSRGLLQPFRRSLPALMLGSTGSPTFRAVAGIHFQAVDEQAGRRKTLIITYLLYWPTEKTGVWERNKWKFALSGFSGGTCLVGPTGGDSIHLKMGLFLFSFLVLSLPPFWLSCWPGGGKELLWETPLGHCSPLFLS